MANLTSVRSDCIDMLRARGIEPVKMTVSCDHWRVCCPFHGSEETPSMVICVPFDSWHCYTCGRGGHSDALSAAFAELDAAS